MKLLTYLVYGLISGFSELVPVSAPAHRQLMQYIFGMDGNTALLNVFVHIGVLLSVLVALRETISRIRREKALVHSAKRKRSGNYDMRAVYDLRIVKTAALPMIIGFVLYAYFGNNTLRLVPYCLMFLLSGCILLLSDHMRQGNKDSRHVSALGAISIGITSAFSAVPGISRIAAGTFCCSLIGTDRSNAYLWLVLLSVPALIVFIFLDVIAAFAIGAGSISFVFILLCMVAALAAFGGGYAAITFMNYLAVRVGFSGFAYYNFGAGIFSFILYLIT